MSDHGITDGSVISVIKQIEHTDINVYNVLTVQSFKMRVPENIRCGVIVRNEVERRWGIPSMRQRLYLDARCNCELSDEDRLDEIAAIANLAIANLAIAFQCSRCLRFNVF